MSRPSAPITRIRRRSLGHTNRTQIMKSSMQVVLRMLRREKLYAAINIGGLSLGIACFLILALFLRGELTYDQHYPLHPRIYRVFNEFKSSGPGEKFPVTSRVLGPLLKADNP